MSSMRTASLFRAAAMAASVVAIALPARADDLLATLSLDMSPETAWPTASDQPMLTAEAATPAPTIPPADVAEPAKPASAAAQPAPAPATPNLPPAPQQTAQTPPPAAPAQPAQGQAPAFQKLSQAQLSQLVAPIALYPDPLLSQILMASTYPLEVVEAARWIEQPGNKDLRGEALLNAAKSQNWDPSVTALVPFPRVLQNMSTQISWTQSLGNAFLAQQSDVMAVVQQLRHEAMSAGNLRQTAQCGCQIKTSGNYISIEPVAAQQVVVPVYSPSVAYGEWLYPGYPPYFFPVPAGFVFAPGLAIGWYPPIYLTAFDPFWYWGWFNWGGGYIAVDPGRFALIGGPRLGGGVWMHDPAHRGGVAYANAGVAARFNSARMTAMRATALGGTARFAASRAVDPAAMHGSTFTHGQGAALHAGASSTHFGATHAAAAFHGGGAFRGGQAFHSRAAFHGGGALGGASVHAARFGGARAAVPHSGGGHPGGGGPHGGGPHGGGGGDHHH